MTVNKLLRKHCLCCVVLGKIILKRNGLKITGDFYGKFCAKYCGTFTEDIDFVDERVWGDGGRGE